jgi:hypothetical protein
MRRHYKFFLLFIVIVLFYFQTKAQNHLMTCPPSPQTITTCEGSFYDGGGNGGNYPANQNCTYTFCSDEGNCMRIEFEDFYIQDEDVFGNVYDYLEVFDGPSTASPLLFYLYGGPFPQQFPTTGSSGCLTFHFVSDASVQRFGWHGEIHCMDCPIPHTALQQDCGGAIPLCESQIYQPIPYSGNNGSSIVPPSSCLLNGEENSTWYIFNAQTAGNFNFVLYPDNFNDNFDFAVYDISNTGCAGIATGDSPEISCNYSANTATWFGQTGINSGGGYNGTLNSQGIGGTSFNASIPVLPYQTFALLVTNPNPLGGYFIDLEPSTADYEDGNQPFIDSVVVVPCPTPTLTIYFAEPIRCNTINASDFTITGGPPITVTAATGIGCSPTQLFTQAVTLNLSTPISGGVYNVNVVSTIRDLCGNNVPLNVPFTFTLSPLADAGSDITTCGLNSFLDATPINSGTGTWTQISSSTGGTTTFDNLNLENTGITVSQLGVYVYEWTVTNGTCISTDLVQITFTSGANAGGNGSASFCSNSTVQSLFANLTGTPEVGGVWTGPSVLSGGSLGNYNPLVNSPGLYTYTITGTGGCPDATATVNVSENQLPNAGISATVQRCINDSPLNLFSSLTGSPQTTGTWSGPSVLGGGYLGIFVPGSSLPGVYVYSITGVPPCPNASSTVTIIINPIPNLSSIYHD